MNQMILLDGILMARQDAYPELSDGEFFEFYCVDNILLDHDLSNEEIEAGIVDGPKDAGIDAAYVFINRNLLAEDFELDRLKHPINIELIVIQAKNQDSFKEPPIDKLSASLPLLLDPNKTREELEALFKPKVVSVFQSYIEARRDLASQFPNARARLYYCCKGLDPNDTMKAKAQALESILSSNNVKFEFLGAQELYERSKKQKRLVKELPVVGSPLSGSNSFVALCNIDKYTDFISDDEGMLLTRMFEANVRAYQGEVEVNKEIAASLSEPTDGVDFWWLNNGVTVVADQAQFMNNRLIVENPLIVNGLQTSYELHSHGQAAGQAALSDDQRLVLVRVLVETDREKRDEIIRATNRQTSIKHSSFRATEPIHVEIEDYFLTKDFFYDRRKNFYKREGKPANRILSIDRLAQGVLAVLKQEPHTARARPTTAIKGENDYQTIFSNDKNTHPLEMYGAVAHMLTKVEGYFKSIVTADNQAHRNNLKFHVLMVLAWALNENKTLPAQRIKQMDLSKLSVDLLKIVTDWVFTKFNDAGPEDRTAKEKTFTERLKTNWSKDATPLSGPPLDSDKSF